MTLDVERPQAADEWLGRLPQTPPMHATPRFGSSTASECAPPSEAAPGDDELLSSRSFEPPAPMRPPVSGAATPASVSEAPTIEAAATWHVSRRYI